MDRISRQSGEEDVWFGNLGIVSLLFVNDVVLLASSSQEIQRALEWFVAVGVRVRVTSVKRQG